MAAIIYQDGIEINRIEADESFAAEYCARHGYTYVMDPPVEPEPAPEPVEPEYTAEERLEDAICELDAATEQRLTAMEEALCELDSAINGGGEN